MINFSNRKVLVLAPHPDDEVFGCGGFIHRLKRESCSVYILYMTNGTTRHFSKTGSTDDVSTAEQRRKEIEKVSEFLQFDGYEVAFEGNDYHLQLDHLPQKKIIHAIERGGDRSLDALRPDIVLIPPSSDYNQDHRATYTAAMTALRPASPHYRHYCPLVLSYELPYQQWNIAQMNIKPQMSVKLSAEDVDAKVAAMKLYPSQLKEPESPLSIHGIRTLAAFRGMHAGTEYAEAFSVERLVI